jgi:glycosyltransferase involved in cell wall biosynthesis
MALIIMTDDGIRFDGRMAESEPLGGAETAFVGLAEGFAARGHRVLAFTNGAQAIEHRGVQWRPISEGPPKSADLYVANRGDKLLSLVPRARSIAFWIHNPARYLLKWRYLWKLVHRRPAIVFCGAFHASTYPGWAPAGARVSIPYGISEVFRQTPPAQEPPPPRAVFTSNPMRSLDWLLDLWVEQIRPRVPGAELHVFSGPRTYGAMGTAKAAQMLPVLERARTLGDSGVLLRGPVAKQELAAEMARMRAYLYRGDPGEAFCTSAGEAQAMGLPAVVQNIACMAERVDDGVTGHVAANRDEFARAAVRILTDDVLWRAQHAAALARKRSFGWIDAAAQFEALFLGQHNAPAIAA